MPEFIVPCPNCQTSLLVDDQNAGTDVLCPGCGVRLTLPHEQGTPPLAEAKEATTAEAAAVKRNFPLHRSGQPLPLPEDAAGAPPSAGARSAHLPERRGLSPEEEMRRLAALTVEPVSFDLHNVDTKGRVAFPCPGCHRPVWMSRSDAGRIVVCEGCTREVIAPNPAKGEHARMAQPDAAADQRQRTVLPSRRQVENQTVGEHPAAGRPKRQGGQLQPAREPAPEPPPLMAERMQTRVTSIEPIPARGDVEMTVALRKGPSAAKRAGPLIVTQEQSAAAAEFDDHLAPGGLAGDLPGAKLARRMNPERVPTFTPKHDADLSAEFTGNWGGDVATENSATFRRILTIAIITLLVAAIGITAFLLRMKFAPPDNSADSSESASPIANVDNAKLVLGRYFKAETIEDMAKEVRHPEITVPRMTRHYAQNRPPRHTVDFPVDWRELDNYEGRGVDFIVTTIRLDALTDRNIYLEIPKAGGLPKLDWEHFVSYSDIPWSEFLRTTSEKPADFRVSITLTDYYNWHFGDRSRYLAFRVTDPEDFGYCFAYCEAKSTLGNLLLESIREGRQNGHVDPATGEGIAQVILRLRYLPEGRAHNQASIDALVWKAWLEP